MFSSAIGNAERSGIESEHFYFYLKPQSRFISEANAAIHSEWTNGLLHCGPRHFRREPYLDRHRGPYLDRWQGS